MRLYGNKCLCGGKWEIRDNGNVGDYFCSKCGEWQRMLRDEELEKYRRLEEKRTIKLKKSISAMFERSIL